MTASNEWFDTPEAAITPPAVRHWGEGLELKPDPDPIEYIHWEREQGPFRDLIGHLLRERARCRTATTDELTAVVQLIAAGTIAVCPTGLAYDLQDVARTGKAFPIVQSWGQATAAAYGAPVQTIRTVGELTRGKPTVTVMVDGRDTQAKLADERVWVEYCRQLRTWQETGKGKEPRTPDQKRAAVLPRPERVPGDDDLGIHTCVDCRPGHLCDRCETVLRHIPLAISIADEYRLQQYPSQRPSKHKGRWISPEKFEERAAYRAAVPLAMGARITGADGKERLAWLSGNSDPLVSVALETMLRIWPDFEPERGVPFGAFCRKAVRGAVAAEASRQFSVVRGGAGDMSLDAGLGVDGDGDTLTGNSFLAAVNGEAGGMMMPRTLNGGIGGIGNDEEDRALDRLSERATRKADGAAWDAATAALSTEDRSIMHYSCQGSTQAEVAAIVGIRQQAVSERLPVIVAKLKAALPNISHFRELAVERGFSGDLIIREDCASLKPTPAGPAQ